MSAVTNADLAGALAERQGRRMELSQAWRAFRTSAHLGWKIEANWTEPLLFFIYSVAKPVAAVLMLVVMLQIISGGNARPEYLAFVVVGSALWAFVLSGITGLTQSTLDDRERYRVLKYLYVSPNALLTLLLGRGLAQIVIGAFGAVVTLTLGILVLGVPFELAKVDWFVLVVGMTVGLVSVIAVAIIMASVAMQTRQDAWHYPEAVAGALFLVVGAVFPLSVLPAFGQWFGLAIPMTWWLESVRRALFPEIVSAIGGEGSVYTSVTGDLSPTATESLVMLLVTTVVVTLAAVVAYRWSEHRAKERGLFDLITGS